jgi:hypothetical protein
MDRPSRSEAFQNKKNMAGNGGFVKSNNSNVTINHSPSYHQRIWMKAGFTVWPFRIHGDDCFYEPFFSN